jgi:hypothetical protein
LSFFGYGREETLKMDTLSFEDAGKYKKEEATGTRRGRT